jgi:membrane-associated protein
MAEFVDLLLHADRFLAELVTQYGAWVYGILFLIVFAETGLVVTPLLPGDSLLFAVGALGAVGALDAPLAAVLLVTAAVLGDAANYAIGRYIGPRVFRATSGGTLIERLLNREHLERAHEFFERYGGKAVVLGRFVPIVRTFVPFVAGAGAMTYPKFALFNVVGALAWVGLCLGAGYAFGNVPVVRDNFTLVALGIVAVSLLPMVFEIVARRRASPPPTRP